MKRKPLVVVDGHISEMPTNDMLTDTPPITPTVGATTSIDCSLADTFLINLTQNTTLDLKFASSGQRIMLCIKQDATGGRTITWPAAARFGADLPSTAVTLSTAANKLDYIGLIYNWSAGKYDVVSINRGF